MDQLIYLSNSPGSMVERGEDLSGHMENLSAQVEKKVEGVAKFYVDPPVVQFPDSIPSKHRAALENHVLKRYEDSLNALELSIADVVNETSEVKSLVQSASNRMIEFLQAYSSLLRKQGALPKFAANNPLHLSEVEFGVYSLLANLYHTGAPKLHVYAGQIGSNPLAAMKVLKEGNLREQILLITSIKKNLLEAIGKQHETGSDIVQEINRELENQSVSWRLSNDLTPVTKGSIYANLSDSVPLRTLRSEDSFEYSLLQANIPTYSDARDANTSRIPLSDREARYARKGLDIDLESNEHLFYSSGELAFVPKTVEDLPDSPYLQATKIARMKVMAGISGTMDHFLSALLVTGLSTREDMYLARLASILWLIDSNSHSVSEILCSSQGYELPFRFAPDYYRELVPQEMPLSEDFYRRLEERQREKGHLMPDACLTAEEVSKIYKSYAF